MMIFWTLVLVFSAEFAFCQEDDDNGDGSIFYTIEGTNQIKESFKDICKWVNTGKLPEEYRYDALAQGPNARIQIYVNLTVYRLVEIDDLKQSMSLYVRMSARWQFEPCDETLLFDLPYIKRAQKGDLGAIAKSDLKDFKISAQHEAWKPILLHLNALKESQEIMRHASVEIYPFVNKARWFSFSRLDTTCDEFAFAKFPFDSLNCTITFDTVEHSEDVDYYIKSFAIDPSTIDDFISDKDVWNLDMENPLTNWVEKVRQNDGHEYFRLHFSLLFHRKYQYFMWSILIPTYCLFVLEMSTLILPPHVPDRPAFSMTVVLAFVVVLSLVFTGIPKTSETVSLVVMIAVKLVTAMVITIYALCTVDVSEKPRKKMKICGRKYSFGRICDVVVFVLAISINFTLDLSLFIEMLC